MFDQVLLIKYISAKEKKSHGQGAYIYCAYVWQKAYTPKKNTDKECESLVTGIQRVGNTQEKYLCAGGTGQTPPYTGGAGLSSAALHCWFALWNVAMRWALHLSGPAESYLGE